MHPAMEQMVHGTRSLSSSHTKSSTGCSTPTGTDFHDLRSKGFASVTFHVKQSNKAFACSFNYLFYIVFIGYPTKVSPDNCSKTVEQ
jgi:hypothetical protein